jgi:hypothetical protein
MPQAPVDIGGDQFGGTPPLVFYAPLSAEETAGTFQWKMRQDDPDQSNQPDV